MENENENKTVVVGVRFTHEEAIRLSRIATAECRTRAGMLYKLAKDHMEKTS